MELRQYYDILRRWLWLIALCALQGAGSAYVISSRTTPVYTASATLLIQQAPSGDGSDYQDILTAERLARTYSEMIQGRPVLENTVEALYLTLSPDDLADKLSVELVRDTQLIRLKVEDTDPGRAARIATGIAHTFVNQIDALQQERYVESMTNLHGQMEEVSIRIDETNVKIDAPDTSDAEAARLESILAGYRNTYSQLVQNYEQLRVTSARSADDVLLFEAARPPTSPTRPQTVMNTALAGVTGVTVGIGIAFLIEYLDDTVKTPTDVEQAAGLPAIGTIGKIEGSEVIARDEPLSAAAEAFRTLRTNIRYSSLDQPICTLLVTSPGPLEGKSLVVANLAVVMTHADLKVVVLDGDLRHPRQHELFGVTRSPGLTDALVHGRTHGMLQHVPQPPEGLFIVPAGELPPNPAELLGSHRMADMVARLRGAADVVLIDSPPVLPVTDAAVLAQCVDAVLLVAKAGSTRGGDLYEAVAALDKVGAHVIGVALNQFSPNRGARCPYHRYHGYYSNGRRKDEAERRGRSRRKKSKPPIAINAFTL